jgi:hypothetical protein
MERGEGQVGNVGYTDMARYDDAEPLILEGLEADRRLVGEDNPDTLVTMEILAGIYRGQGRLVEAERLCRETLRKRRRVSGADDPWTLESLHELARIRADQGEREEALDLLRQAVEGGFTHWDDPSLILEAWRSFDGNPEYEAIVGRFRESIEKE